MGLMILSIEDEAKGNDEMSKADETGFVGIENNYLVIDITQQQFRNLYTAIRKHSPSDIGALQAFVRGYCENLAWKNGYDPSRLRGIKNLADERE